MDEAEDRAEMFVSQHTKFDPDTPDFNRAVQAVLEAIRHERAERAKELDEAARIVIDLRRAVSDLDHRGDYLSVTGPAQLWLQVVKMRLSSWRSRRDG
jgi:hypothetical protein